MGLVGFGGILYFHIGNEKWNDPVWRIAEQKKP